jgi:DNA-binding response OmpR family regulator
MTDAVLIVDDSLTVRMDLAEAFTSGGFEPVLCASGEEAQAALARRSVAVIVLDVVLPDTDGIALMQRIRGLPANEHVPILLLSSEAEVSDRIRGLQTGADDYVGKPYDAGYVVARARELLRPVDRLSEPSPTTVLLIDDSTTFREELRRLLEEAGYEVSAAATGEEGLRMAGALLPDAVLVDSVLPGIDGGTVIRKMRLDAALRATPCILLTGSEGAEAELRALDAGADAFLRKDEEGEVILARLAALLRGIEARRQGTTALLAPKRVMAVDDSVTYLQELATILRGEGYDVVLAHSGEEAVDMLAVQSVDCILMDVIMPGWGGHETCRRIKASPIARDTPLILLTAFEGPGAMVEGLAGGADDFIAKSMDFDVLRARVRAQIRRKQVEDEHRRIREELLRSELAATEERAARQVAETRASLVEELERKNEELETFSYSVSHDLRAPLRAIDGFSRALLEDCADKLDATSLDYLQQVLNATSRMGALIDDLLKLSRVGRAEIKRTRVDVSALAQEVADDLRRRDPQRTADVVIAPGLTADADPGLLKIVLENLMGNAWKFTSKVAAARLEVGRRPADGGEAFFVRDNGAGFDAQYAEKLFRPFQRLHGENEFPGTGIGLATVHRIVDRHGGRAWAEGAKGEGATMSFALPAAKARQDH